MPPKTLLAAGVQAASDPIERMRGDLRLFLHVIWTKHLNLPPLTPIQNDISLFLMNVPERAIIEAFRGVGKSFLTSGYVVWNLWNDPQLKIMVVSASKDRADAFSGFTKKLIAEIPFLNHLRPKNDQRDSLVAFDVGPATPDQSPSVKSVGITGQLTGSRADIIIADDVEVPGNSATALMRERLGELVKEFDAILKPLPTARVIYLGTPQCEMSLYNALQERGYVARVWPALYPKEEDLGSYKGTLAPLIVKRIEADKLKHAGRYTIEGKPTDPVRFSEDDLYKRRLSYGAAGFALQFMLNTSLSDADKYPLRCSDLIVLTVDPERAPVKFTWAADASVCLNTLQSVGLHGDRYYRPLWMDSTHHEFEGCVMAIDPSGRGKDETAYAIIKQLGGMLYLVASGGFRGGYKTENLEALATLCKQHSVKAVVVESNFGDGMFSELLKPVMGRIYPCSVEEVRSSGQKELRIIDVLEPVISTHRLVVDPRVIQTDLLAATEDIAYSLFYQMTRITKDRGALAHDDRLDALSMAVAYFVQAMARDSNKASQKLKDKLMDKELKQIIQNLTGRKYGSGGMHNRGLKVRRR